MDMSQKHNQLLQSMIAQCGDELRDMGEHGLADGTELINPEVFIQGALAHATANRQSKPKPKKNKSQKAARRKNRK